MSTATHHEPTKSRFLISNPFAKKRALDAAHKLNTPYEKSIQMGRELIEKPLLGGGASRILVQHSKGRMTVFERIKVLTKEEPNILYQNWGANLDGAGIVTGILKIGDRDVAVYGHDFTNRAGSMDSTNGEKIARHLYMAAEHGIPVIGMNDSAGAYVPAGVGGLDGYSEAFCAMRKISGVVPSISLMFGFNAGGGAYLPRQGTFMIQHDNTFFGLTGPGVVREVLGEDVTPDELGGPGVHGQSGVVDIVAADELGSLRKALRLLSYLPDNNHTLAPYHPTNDPIDRIAYEEASLLQRTFNSPTGFNTPFDITLLIQQIVDHGEYFEIQPQRARNLVTAFGRLGGHVVGILANNSAVASGQIDVDAAQKGARFIRVCNLYNIPTLFLEDTTGFLPGKEQETRGIIQAGRGLLDSIIDLRVPRILLIVRNAFGGAYASWNPYHTGADIVFTFPTARIAVMGPAGKEYVFKEELQKARAHHKRLLKEGKEEQAIADLNRTLADLTARYEEMLMNPKEALSLGSISSVVMPGESRKVLGNYLAYCLRHYKPEPMSGPQREFH
jgi:acetyl-CoA carboxylase carboxyltransferase component